MASFYGRQQAVDKGTNQPAAALASPSACLKSCEKVMNQCLVDATTFMEKERCRDRYDICSGKCGATEQPAATKPPITSREVTPAPGGGEQSYVLGGDPRECSNDAKCISLHGKGWFCEDGECKKKGSEVRPCGPGNPCLPSRDYTCVRGECVKITSGTCKVNDDCPTGYVCDGRICVPATPCKVDADCSAGEGCKNGICQPIPNIKPCNNTTNPCPAGYKCEPNGDCVPIVPPPPKTCVEGAKCTDASQCSGGSCINGKCYCKSGSCKDDATCVRLHTTGWTCYKTAGSATGICKPPGGGGDCAPGKKCTGPKRPNPQCGGLTCFRPKSWDEKDESVPGTCYCNQDKGQEEKKGGGDGDGTLGEYQWPSEMTDLYGRLMGKAGDYLDMDLPNYNLPPKLQTLLDSLLGRAGEYLARKPGYSQTALDAQFGKGYENIRNLGTLARQQAESGLQKEGMLGTGAGQAALRQIPWQTEKNISDVVRDVFLGNEEQKRKDLESFTNISSGLFGQGVGVEQMVEAINAERRGEERDYTGIANQLFGSGMTYNQLQEAINAARRGEGQNALAMYMQYIMSLMSSWKS